MGSIQFGREKIAYTIPQELDLMPEFLLDEERAVYRVVLGKYPLTPEEQEQYKKIYRAIDKKLQGTDFIDGFVLVEGDRRLRALIAYVLRYAGSYELEIPLVEATFQKETDGVITKDKTTKGKRKAADKSASV